MLRRQDRGCRGSLGAPVRDQRYAADDDGCAYASVRKHRQATLLR
jgi:hypothetical protein